MEQRRKTKRYIIKRIKKTPYFLFYLYLIFVLTSLFSVASYTWFTISRTPEVSNMNLYITSGNGLELSVDPGAAVWTNQVDIYDSQELIEYKGKEEKPSLRQTTWSDQEGHFLGPLYGYDGRLMPLGTVDYTTMQIVSWYPLEDMIHSNQLTPSSYYLKATIYARSDQPTDVTLTAPMALDSQGTPGQGTYLIADPDTGGRGPETAVRAGMRMTLVDNTGQELEERGSMYVYEPNADRHADGSTNYIPTSNIYAVDSTLVSEDRLIRQAFSKPGEPGEFLSNPVLFSIKPGQIIRIEIYLWLEGQDVDCSNIMAHATDETRILANIQFTGTTENQSGMTSIDQYPVE